jgi:PAS domain S-box-containing protein
MGTLVREMDWASTPIGAPETWSAALRTVVSLVLANRFPQLLWWGPDYISIYNDAYRPILGRKHPWGLGKPVRECWSEIWSVLKPLIDTPFHGGPSTWVEDIELEIQRAGFTEETHFTVAYSPVPDDMAPGGIGGVLATVHEITEKVVGARRIGILRELGSGVAEARTAEDACAVAAATLARHPKDIPFALLYAIDPDGERARLAGSCGFREASSGCGPAVVDLTGYENALALPLARARRAKEMQTIESPSAVLAEVPEGPWSEPPHTAVVVPIRSTVAHQLSGFLVAGISSRLRLDEAYRNFLELATSQIATAVANARAYEEERRRAEALAEIDRAKTAFFSNVSHEFRTPLTLMLGPLEGLLAKEATLPGAEREQIAIAHRNALRLLKLVNSLLDFSRIEAGRVKASYAPVDLAALTADLASNFRSALEAAGLELEVDCPPLPQPVYVDREMWEKIVLNLLSNAFKFTFEGRITVRMAAQGEHAVLTVADTGTGIPEAELPHIFERFHRVEGAKGRTYEGTGIGLALIQELVGLHGGTIAAKSEQGKGSSFRIALPFRNAHVPQDRIAPDESAASSTFRGDAYTREAISWLANPAGKVKLAASTAPPLSCASPRPRVILADDNADMREHISHILGEGYDVVAVSNGADALEAAGEQTPEIVLTDVMMPGLDGFGLLRKLRAHSDLRDVPVILISARAGEEARTEGIHAGADDYITKPFSANELLARVANTLHLQHVRRESLAEIARSENRFRAFVTASSDVIYRMSADWSEMRHLQGKSFIPDTTDPTRSWLEKYIHPDDQPAVLSAIQAAIRNKSAFELEHRVIRVDGTHGWIFSRAIPLLDSQGEIEEWFGAARDVTAEREAAERLRFMAESMPQKIATTTPDGEVNYINRQWTDYTGLSLDDMRNSGWTQFIHPEDLEENVRLWREAVGTGEPLQLTHRFRRADGEYRWHLSRSLPLRGADGKITMWIGSSTEIHEQKRIEEELRRANQDLEQFAYSVSHDLQEPLRGIKIFSELLSDRYRPKLDGQALEFLDNVRQGARRLETLLHDLLAYTQAGKVEPPREPVNAGDALEAALENLAGAVAESGAKIEAGPLAPVLVAPGHLQQLFQNLIGNAIKYRQPGVPPTIRVEASREREFRHFTVSDNGIGIEPEYKETIFGLFKRLHAGDEFSGTGMGLAICQRIVERYHGRIWVESEPGRGSVFHFTLPAVSASRKAPADSHR